MRQLGGPTEGSVFDNPSGNPALPGVEEAYFDRVFDFGCGCGRVARQMIQQRKPPREYLGIDIHRGMIDWCRNNLTPRAPGFRFEHFDAYNIGFNPNGARTPLRFPAETGRYTLVNAWSVFTHILEPDVSHYLAEVRRVMAADATPLPVVSGGSDDGGHAVALHEEGDSPNRALPKKVMKISRVM